MSSNFSMKTKKRKVTKCLRSLKEFLHRFDSANEKYLSIFLTVFARIVKATHFAQVINSREFHVKNSKQKILHGLYKTKSYMLLESVTQFVTWESPPNTCQNKCIYKHPINPKYIKQWITYHFKMYIGLGTFRYNCARGQLNNKGRGALHEIKRSRDKAKTGKETISFEQISFEVTCACDGFRRVLFYNVL